MVSSVLAASGAALPKLVWSRDITYVSRPERDLLADLVRPEGGEALPVIIWLHGGGFRLGNRQLAPDLGEFFAAAGYAMLAIDYRLSHEAVFPAAFEDVLAAIAWVAANGPAFGLDATRLGLWGSSAGAWAASMAASAGARRMYGGITPARLRAAVIGYPPVSFAEMDALHAARTGAEERSAETGSRPEQSREAMFLGGRPADLPERARLACPLTHIDGSEPPCLILHGNEDRLVPPAQSEALFETLAAHGAQAELVRLDGLGHAFFNNDVLRETAPRSGQRRSTAAPQTRADALHLAPLIAAFFAKHLLTA